MWKIVYYETTKGDVPVKKFIDGLDCKMRARAAQEIALLQEKGNAIRMPFSKPLRNGIFELRIQAASDISRIFYFFYDGKRIVLTNGFIKKTQQTPVAEIEKALRYKADYERRAKAK